MKRNRMRSRQSMSTGFRMRLVVGASIFVAASLLLIVVFNLGDVKDSRAFSSGDYRTATSGNWEETEVWEVFDGESWIPASAPPDGAISSVTVTSGQKMVLSDEIVLSSLIIEKDARLAIESNQIKMVRKGGKGGVTCDGELVLGSSIIDGDGDFFVGPEATLMIGSFDGIHKKEKKGNIQTKGKREFSKEAFYVFNGTVRQHSGNGLPSSLKNLVIENRAGVELDQSFTITHYLGLRKGVLYTGTNLLTLGSSVNETVSLDFTEGALNGKVNFWYGQGNLDRMQFPFSDGSSVELYNFRSDVKAWQKGMIEFTYREGIPDDSQKSPFEARQVVIGITKNGYFNARMSNGPDEAWLKYMGTSPGEEGRRSHQWNISTHDHSLTASSGGGGRAMSFSNLMYGPQPFGDKIVFRFYSESKSTSFIQLMNGSGRMVFNTKLGITEGYNQTEITVDPSLPAGNYILQISNANEIQTMKVVKDS